MPKKGKISIYRETKLFNQIIISNKEDATQKFSQICEVKSIVEPSNNYNNNDTEQLDVDDQAMGIQSKEDIIMEILSKLPVRSLLRFKCVSKFWKALIIDPYFKKKHFNHAKNDGNSQKLLISLLCLRDDKYNMYCCPLSPLQQVEHVQKLDCPSLPTALHCIIRCCCDGLVIIEARDIIDSERLILFLFNPSTRESIVLPDPEFPWRPSLLGLAYDSTSGEYKILKVYDGELPSEILALKGGSWRKIDKHPRGICSVSLAMHSLAFVHESFHWIGCISQSYFLISFSISTEVYGEIPIPKQMVTIMRGKHVGVSVLEGMLCVYTNFNIMIKATLQLWVLKDYGVKESWTLLLTIEDPMIVMAVPRYRFADGELLYWCMRRHALAHAFRTSSGPFVLWPRCDTVQHGFAFTESLISPKSLTY
ncbi:F-box protein CPR1-like isoform X2 [Lycium ferocissimum]|uniref:F-box protein CPR1-like isoform X2 n=1 Tax=Lycium ferocissimum TaxID=112874 RepID=UPI0028155738|nr:F-box protein CPR1-like isoform X2 [Lycium ferocissimum]